MSKYQYIIQNNTVKVIGADHPVSVYNLSSWNPAKIYYYRSLLAQKRDIDYAEAYLNQMFFDEGTSLIDGALINSAIQLLVKCFSNPSDKGRRCLDSKKVFRTYAKKIGEQDLTIQFEAFYIARNTVLAHDQNDYKDNILGLAVNAISGDAEDIFELTTRTTYLYKQNKEILLRLVNVVSRYIDDQLASLRSLILSDYNENMDKPKLPDIECKNISISNSW